MTLVSIAVIPIMAYLNAPSLSTKIGSIRPRPNSPRTEAVVEAGGRFAGRGRGDGGNQTNTRGEWKGKMLRCLQRLPLIVALENITENGAWLANLAGGIPPILLDIVTNGSLILSPFPFLPLIFSGLNQGRILLREAVVGL